MPKRRMGTRPIRTNWTPAAVTLIETYQQQQHLTSFSAAAETLVRLGLQQSVPEIVTPAITDAVRTTVRKEVNRLARVHILTAIDAGLAWRLAAATLQHVVPAQYERRMQAAHNEARKAVGRQHLRDAADGVLPELEDLW
jgi:hypothetical protein